MSPPKCRHWMQKPGPKAYYYLMKSAWILASTICQPCLYWTGYGNRELKSLPLNPIPVDWCRHDMITIHGTINSPGIHAMLFWQDKGEHSFFITGHTNTSLITKFSKGTKGFMYSTWVSLKHTRTGIL